MWPAGKPQRDDHPAPSTRVAVNTPSGPENPRGTSSLTQAIKQKGRAPWRELLERKLHNAGDAARTATRRADGTFSLRLWSRGLPSEPRGCGRLSREALPTQRRTAWLDWR